MAGDLAALLGTDRLGKLTRGIHKAVAQSFVEDKFKPAPNEIRRRFNFCIECFHILNAVPYTWSIMRINDEMGHYLRHKLDGLEWKPSTTRAMYAPDGYKKLIL